MTQGAFFFCLRGMQSLENVKWKKPGKALKPCRASSYRMEPAGIEPATSGLQSFSWDPPIFARMA